MPRTGSGTGLAIHIGADVLASPRYLRWPPSRPCRDTIERMSRLCTAAGIPTQQHLLGVDACVGRVRGALAEAAANLDPSGLLVVTFAGHSERGEPDEQGNRDIGWCLYDGTLPLRETAQLLAAVPATGRVVLVADTCYAAAFARYASSASTLVLLAACAENQTTPAYATGEFIPRLERLVFPRGVRNPDCVTYAWLHDELRRDTPDAERPQVWTNQATARTQQPFNLDEW